MNTATLVKEYGELIRSELDIEQLLRTTLEYILGRCGPTNAAVFLPSSSGDYALGAYVNYDCPKETVDVLLDHLANAVAPRFEHQRHVAHFTSAETLHATIGDTAGWLDSSNVVAFSCESGPECLAIFMLFRDRLTPYPPSLLAQFETIADLFGSQLAKVLRIHHRHLPKEKWQAPGDPEDFDDIDGLAA